MHYTSLLGASSALMCLLFSYGAGVSAAKDDPPSPCTIKSPTTGSYFDLSGLAVMSEDKRKKSSPDRTESWHARGYDYGANFTLNFCAPVVEQLEDVRGLETAAELRNISAFYKKGSHTYSLGGVSTEPKFRGRKLVLEYRGGSPCPAQPTTSSLNLAARELVGQDADKKKGSSKDKDDKGKDKGGDDDDEDDDNDKPKKGKGGDPDKPDKSELIRRKSTIISFLCDRDPNAPKAVVSYVGTTDECSYMFEVRSPIACGGASTSTEAGSVGPAGVFGLIALIAVAAYILGGVAYQRTVMHQRGWKQLPNYGTWAGIGSFVKDSVIIAFSSCSQLIPSRRGGYNQLPVYSDRSRFSRNEDENRLIDQLDEEWDD